MNLREAIEVLESMLQFSKDNGELKNVMILNDVLQILAKVDEECPKEKCKKSIYDGICPEDIIRIEEEKDD